MEVLVEESLEMDIYIYICVFLFLILYIDDIVMFFLGGSSEASKGRFTQPAKKKTFWPKIKQQTLQTLPTCVIFLKNVLKKKHVPFQLQTPVSLWDHRLVTELNCLSRDFWTIWESTRIEPTTTVDE